MNKITQEEFDALPVVNGIKYCPSFTDYSDIKVFCERCSFDECCRFGKGCLYCDNKFKKLYQFCGFGSVGRTTRVYLLDTGTCLIECGCQVGKTVDEFEKRIRETYSEDGEEGAIYYEYK